MIELNSNLTPWQPRNLYQPGRYDQSVEPVHRHYLQYCVNKCWSLSHALLFATPWTAVHQAPLSMGFSRQGYRSGLPFPSPGDLTNPGIEPGSPALQADSLPIELDCEDTQRASMSSGQKP